MKEGGEEKRQGFSECRQKLLHMALPHAVAPAAATTSDTPHLCGGEQALGHGGVGPILQTQALRRRRRRGAAGVSLRARAVGRGRRGQGGQAKPARRGRRAGRWHGLGGVAGSPGLAGSRGGVLLDRRTLNGLGCLSRDCIKWVCWEGTHPGAINPVQCRSIRAPRCTPSIPQARGPLRIKAVLLIIRRKPCW